MMLLRLLALLLFATNAEAGFITYSFTGDCLARQYSSFSKPTEALDCMDAHGTLRVADRPLSIPIAVESPDDFQLELFIGDERYYWDAGTEDYLVVYFPGPPQYAMSPDGVIREIVAGDDGVKVLAGRSAYEGFGVFREWWHLAVQNHDPQRPDHYYEIYGDNAVFSVVPEPSTLALALLVLGAARLLQFVGRDRRNIAV